MRKRLGIITGLGLVMSLLAAKTVLASYTFVFSGPQLAIDPAYVAPIGLVIFGIASLGMGAVGYILSLRRSETQDH
ncbi:MAG: hypothetical protein ACOYZ7_13595 [Chloroflexota bacterium]